jgi:hypothetical protein
MSVTCLLLVPRVILDASAFPWTPFFDPVREPSGSLTHPPRAHSPEADE